MDAIEWGIAITAIALVATGARFVATGALLVAPYAARGLAAALPSRLPPRFAAPWMRAGLVATACVAIAVPEWRAAVEPPPGLSLDLRRAPVSACDFIERHGVRGRGFGPFYFGGYQVWRFAPDVMRLPFLDIHPEDAPTAQREEYVRAFASPAGLRALDGVRHFDYVLLSRRYQQGWEPATLLDESPEFALVFVDDVSALYVRRTGPMAPVAERFAYRRLRGRFDGFEASLASAAMDASAREEMLAELHRQAGETSQNFYGRRALRALGAGD